MVDVNAKMPAAYEDACCYEHKTRLAGSDIPRLRPGYSHPDFEQNLTIRAILNYAWNTGLQE